MLMCKGYACGPKELTRVRVSEISSAAQMEEALSFWRTECEARCVIGKAWALRLSALARLSRGRMCLMCPRSQPRVLDGSAYSAW